MKLTSSARTALPSGDFAIPSQRKYPIMDAGHRQAARGRVAEWGTPAEKQAVASAIKKKFGEVKKNQKV